MAAARTYSLADKRQDAKDAFDKAARYHAELKDIYQYYMPFRAPTTERAPGAGTQAEGAKRTQMLLDGTGPSAAASFAANLVADWMPSFQNFFLLEPTPLWQSEDREQRARDLQVVTEIAHVLFKPVRMSVLEMASDTFAGTGAMFLDKGERNYKPVRGVAVPPLELALDTGADGDIDRIFWKRNYKARHLEERWPDAKFGERLKNLINQTRNADVEVTQYTYFDHRERRWQLCVWTNCDDTILRTASWRTRPWVIPRGWVVPGEPFARGFAHLGLPFVKTVNKARELALRAAAFALLGLWTHRHDQVFNPDTAIMSPGAMWKVGFNGGPLGPTIQRLDIPHNFDISTVIINDEREQIRRVLGDDEMPDITDRVRSPTEIAGRMRRYDRNRAGMTARLGIEMVTATAPHLVEIMEDLGYIPGKLEIDQILTQATVVSPAAAAQRIDKVERMVSWLQIMIGLFGQEAAAVAAKVDEILPELGRLGGVDEQFIATKAEAKQLKQLIADSIARIKAEAQMKAEQKPGGGDVASAPQEPTEAAEMAYMNGGF